MSPHASVELIQTCCPWRWLLCRRYTTLLDSDDALTPIDLAVEHDIIARQKMLKEQKMNLIEIPEKVFAVSSKSMVGMPELVTTIKATVQNRK